MVMVCNLPKLHDRSAHRPQYSMGREIRTEVRELAVRVGKIETKVEGPQDERPPQGDGVE